LTKELAAMTTLWAAMGASLFVSPMLSVRCEGQGGW